jgi:HlyD family secretion protein
VTQWIKRIAMLAVALVLAGAFYYALREQPVAVDTATVERAPMKVTLVQEGVTRIRHVYTISAPIAGHLARPVLVEGDPVQANRTVIASIHPLDPPLLDQRTLAELRAQREAANAAIAVAASEVARTEAELAHARREFERASRLATRGAIPEMTVQKAANDVTVLEAQLKAGTASIALRQAELANIEAKLRQPDDREGAGYCCVELKAPVDGVVLDVFAESEQPVNAGTRIADVGDPGDLEVSVDLLSSDAVQIRPGTPAAIVDWGGGRPLTATVRRIDPSAFTKVSALGIEEQRVNAVLDLGEKDARLGHGFRVYAEITLWQAPSVAQVPISALFRQGTDWSVFAVEDGKARLRTVRIGHMNDRTAELLDGLAENALIVVHPSDLIEDGRGVLPRR